MDTLSDYPLPRAYWVALKKSAEGREIACCYRCGKKLADYYPHGFGDAIDMIEEITAAFGPEWAARFVASRIFLLDGYERDASDVWSKTGTQDDAYGFGRHRAVRHTHRTALSNRDFDWQDQPEAYPRADGQGVDASPPALKAVFPHVVICHARGCGARQIVTRAPTVR